jgi:uncharacterized C2H2 Zn-finger protein
MEAFVYCWSDLKTSKVYVGYHKGKIDDGYVCSSKDMNIQYKLRTTDFVRTILFQGSTKESYIFEQAIIKSLLKDRKTTYNKGMGCGYIPANKGVKGVFKHSQKAKDAISKNNVNKGKIGHWLNATKPDHYEKLSILFSNVKDTVVKCPHCDILGGSRNMKFWHFDNCKNNPNILPEKLDELYNNLNKRTSNRTASVLKKDILRCAHCTKTYKYKKQLENHINKEHIND